MKLSISKSTLAIVVAITASYLVTPAVYADAYVRLQDAVENQSYVPVDANNYQKFSELNATYLGGAAYPNKHYLSIPEKYYLALPGYLKRRGVFKLQKSVDGTKDGRRENLVMDTKAEAEDFCKYLAKTVGELSNPAIVGTVFVSDWLGGIKEVIALAYKVDYQGGDLTPAKKHVFCPNHWQSYDEYWNKPDPKFADENETTGVRASGFGNRDKSTYKVACMNAKADATFTSRSHVRYDASLAPTTETDWTSGNYTYATYGTSLKENPSLESMDILVGNQYCSAQ